MFDAERLSMIPARAAEAHGAERPYQHMGVAAVAAALDAEIALEIAIAQLADKARAMVMAAREKAPATPIAAVA
ncbi:MAG: hypothetical protein K2Y29_14535 [Beijerinckiaceae bacterium]|nr:hypothetical protein [Beijerinckiaceae bacterium]